MIRTTARALVVWAAVTAVATATGRWALDGSRLREIGSTARFEVLLPGVAGLALAGCAVWLWLVTTVVVGAALRRPEAPRTVRGVPRWVARAVLAACGVAVLTAAPGHAAGPGEPGLDGLPYPDRATGAAHRAPAAEPPVPHGPAGPGPAPRSPTSPATPADAVRVHARDSLWSIGVDRLGRDAPVAALADHTAALHALNRAVIGADPDLIQPGQRLRLPPLDPTDPTHP